MYKLFCTRYDNDHEMFKEICSLLKESFFDEKENGYISFATDAINVIFHVNIILLLY